MPKKTEFHAVDFFREIRDRQAAILAGKPPAEIIAFFRQTRKIRTRKGERVTRRAAVRRK
ncbi:MAG TPA: hypothetical protein VFW37_03425 [Alphaproteobacteria bacterium]|nr:hypothetical protein [Alphaproteobacteria bacterium]